MKVHFAYPILLFLLLLASLKSDMADGDLPHVDNKTMPLVSYYYL